MHDTRVEQAASPSQKIRRGSRLARYILKVAFSTSSIYVLYHQASGCNIPYREEQSERIILIGKVVEAVSIKVIYDLFDAFSLFTFYTDSILGRFL